MRFIVKTNNTNKKGNPQYMCVSVISLIKCISMENNYDPIPKQK